MEEKKDKIYAFLNTKLNKGTARLGVGCGYANGYVAVPPTHPFHMVDYSETDKFVCVHGGLTFGLGIDYLKLDKDWVQYTECIGFDSLDDIPAGYWVVGFDTIRLDDEGLNRDWCIEETLRLKNQLEAMQTGQPRTAAGHK